MNATHPGAAAPARAAGSADITDWRPEDEAFWNATVTRTSEEASQLLRAGRVEEAERIVQVYTEDTKHPGSYRLASYPIYRDLVAQAPGFEGILAYNLTTGEPLAAAGAASACTAIRSIDTRPITGIALDVTERKQIEVELERARDAHHGGLRPGGRFRCGSTARRRFAR